MSEKPAFWKILIPEVTAAICLASACFCDDYMLQIIFLIGAVVSGFVALVLSIEYVLTSWMDCKKNGGHDD
jgi:hypothetical protein